MGTGYALSPESIIKRPKSHKDSFEADGRRGHHSWDMPVLGNGCKGMKLVWEAAGWSNPPSHPRTDTPRWQPLGGRAQGDGTNLKAWEKCILLVDAHMDAPTGCSPLLQAKAPAAQGSPTLAIGALGQSKNRASSTPCPPPLSQPPHKFSSGTFLTLMQFVYPITLNQSLFQPLVQVLPEPTQTLHVHSPPWVLTLPVVHQLLASCHSPSPCTMTPTIPPSVSRPALTLWSTLSSPKTSLCQAEVSQPTSSFLKQKFLQP